MGELLGITGAVGSGKTTLATLLAQTEPSHALYETGELVAEIGNAFNEALKAEMEFATAHTDVELTNQVLIWLPESISERLHYDLVWNQLAINQRETLANPKLYSRLFAYLKKVHIRPALLRRAITAKNKEDYRELLQWLGGYLVAKVSKTIWYDELMRRIQQRDDDKKLVIVCGVRYPTDAEVIAQNGGRIVAITRTGLRANNRDITEEQRSAIKPDITIVNNGSIKDLRALVERLWSDLSAQTITQQYHALNKSGV